MFKSLSKYGQLNTYDLLKFIACVLMIVDHIGMFFLKDQVFLRVLGRAAYPIFAFCIGYNKSYKITPVLVTLGVLMAALTLFLEPERRSVIGALRTSIIPSIIIVKMCMSVLHIHLNRKFTGSILIILMFLLLHSYMILLYGFFGLLFAIFGFLSREGRIKEYMLPLFITFFLYVFIEGYGAGYLASDYFASLIMFALMIYIFTSFYIKPIKITSNILSESMLVISRRSLIVYFIHYEVMYIVQYLL